MLDVILTTHCPTLERFVHLSYSFRLLMQTATYSNVVVVDNSANDGYMDSRGKYISHSLFKEMSKKYTFEYHAMPYNTGMAYPKNFAVDLTSNEYIVFVDNDLFYYPKWDTEITKITPHNGVTSLIQANKKYLVNDYGVFAQYSKVSPGVVCIQRETYKKHNLSWNEKHEVPGRQFLRDVRNSGLRLYAPTEPLVEHLGFNQRTHNLTIKN